MNEPTTTRSYLEGLIEDLKDSIDDYKDTMKRTDSRIERYEYRIRCDELKRWKKSLEILLEELED